MKAFERLLKKKTYTREEVESMLMGTYRGLFDAMLDVKKAYQDATDKLIERSRKMDSLANERSDPSYCFEAKGYRKCLDNLRTYIKKAENKLAEKN
jgi:hypothetical protein